MTMAIDVVVHIDDFIDGFGLAHLGPDQRGGPAETEEVDVETLDGLAQRLGLELPVKPCSQRA